MKATHRPYKRLLYDGEAREALRAGVEIVARAVGTTLGPKGRYVLLTRRGDWTRGDEGGLTVTNDGITVARDLEVREPGAAVALLQARRVVVTAPWRTPEVTTEQLAMMHRFRQGATPQMKDRFAGMLQTVWSSAESFIDRFYGRSEGSADNRNNGDVESFKALFDGINNLAEGR